MSSRWKKVWADFWGNKTRTFLTILIILAGWQFSMAQEKKLPNITILATGGTIAGAGVSSSRSGGGGWDASRGTARVNGGDCGRAGSSSYIGAPQNLQYASSGSADLPHRGQNGMVPVPC